MPFGFRKIIVAAFAGCLSLVAFGQTLPHSYVVKFTDKHNSPYSLSSPHEFLSAKTIERRQQFNLGFDSYDLPINPNYIEQVQQLCHCQVASRSKWLNAVVLHLSDTASMATISQLPFVKEVQRLSAPSNERQGFSDAKLAITEVEDDTQYYSDGLYGKGINQIEMHNGQLLHELGYRGQGMDIAVLDAGFQATDKLPVFEKLRAEGRIKMTRDFALGLGTDVYNWSTHGTSCLSIIAAEQEGMLVGTAPAANYYLFRTENVQSETPEEEYNWAAAAEVCDSLGIDIINTSLGYSLFDDSTLNHTYADMDGNTTIITRASDIAAAKGMLVVNSAGNSGDDPWFYITAPADGDSVLAIGAVDSLRQQAFFSSNGPSFDGRVKPNVMAMGQAAAYAATDSTIRRGNGTSFSGPVITGMAACLWQAFPQKSNMEIFSAIEQSAHLHHNPNGAMGYGIPDFWKAFASLQSNTKVVDEWQVQLYPNPCVDYLNVIFGKMDETELSYHIYDALGNQVYSDKGVLISGNTGVLQLNIAVRHLAAGTYSLQLVSESRQSTVKFIKLNTEKK